MYAKVFKVCQIRRHMQQYSKLCKVLQKNKQTNYHKYGNYAKLFKTMEKYTKINTLVFIVY